MWLEYANRQTPAYRRPLSTATWIIIIVIGWSIYQLVPRLFDSQLDYLEVDIRSGRIRHVHHFLDWDFHEQIQDTAISLAVARPTATWPTPDWKAMFIFDADGTVTRHDCAFGIADYEIHDLTDLWHDRTFTADAKRIVARNVLNMWQTSRETVDGTNYISAVSNAAETIAQDSPRPIDTSDLPAMKLRIR